MKYYLFFFAASLILIATTSQTNKPTTIQKTSCDSSITLKQVLEFNTFLKQAASYDQYSKLTPEATLTELWNWKLRTLADTTKRK